MSPYEILPHTADIRLQVHAGSLPALFQEALSGMGFIQRSESCSPEQKDWPVRYELKITAPDQTSLLIDFLSEALSLGHIHQVLFCGCTIHHLSETTLHAEIMGIPNTTWDRDIKAVTYHEAELIQSPGGGWETTIILDI